MDQFLHRIAPRGLCAYCRHNILRTLYVSRSLRYGLQGSPRNRRYSQTTTAPDGHQASPLEGYYKILLESSTHTPLQEQAPSESPLASQARVIFGSRLAGPSSRPPKPRQLIAGILVPPRPTEPDNCCMSGCVNCVWDLYRDEMEEWAAASKEARRRLGKQGTGLMRAGDGTLAHVVTSMDDDGGGSEGNWDGGGGLEQEDLFGNIPVGIREFMRTEKRLKEKHRKVDRNADS